MTDLIQPIKKYIYDSVAQFGRACDWSFIALSTVFVSYKFNIKIPINDE